MCTTSYSQTDKFLLNTDKTNQPNMEIKILQNAIKLLERKPYYVGLLEKWCISLMSSCTS